MSVVAYTKTQGTKHASTLTLNMFSAKEKTRKTFGFPCSRARSYGDLSLVYDSHTNRQNSILTLPSRTLYHQQCKNEMLI